MERWLLKTSGIVTRAPSQYPKRRLFVRSREVSKPRDLYLELSDRSEIWQALWQHCCRCACQISKRYDNLKYQSRGFETSRDLTKRRLFGYWDGAQGSISQMVYELKTKSLQLSFDSDIYSNESIRSQFSTCHDSWDVWNGDLIGSLSCKCDIYFTRFKFMSSSAVCKMGLRLLIRSAGDVLPPDHWNSWNHDIWVYFKIHPVFLQCDRHLNCVANVKVLEFYEISQ